MEQQKERYTEPTLVSHELLRDITAQSSGIVKLREVCSKGADASCL